MNKCNIYIYKTKLIKSFLYSNLEIIQRKDLEVWYSSISQLFNNIDNDTKKIIKKKNHNNKNNKQEFPSAYFDISTTLMKSTYVED